MLKEKNILGGCHSKPIKIVVIGAGNVGSTFAYTLLLSGIAAEIVLIDENRSKAEGEVMDMDHAMPFTPIARVWEGDYEDCAGAAIVVIAVGRPQKPGEAMLDFVNMNTSIFKEIIPKIVKNNPNGIMLVVTDPVEIMTRVALKLSGFPKERVFGSGTILDTAHFRYLLSQHFGVDLHSVQAYIIGEAGDNEVPVWSLVNIAGMPLSNYCAVYEIPYDKKALHSIFLKARNASYEIAYKKGANYYAIAAGLVYIVDAILRNRSMVLPVSSLINDYYGINDICLSLPTVIKQTGIERVICLELNSTEINGIQRSAKVLESMIEKLDIKNVVTT